MGERVRVQRSKAAWQERNPSRRSRLSDSRAEQGLSAVVDVALPSGGQPLDADSRTFMEPRFGHDFSQVRIHTGAGAAESAQALNALAYTVGSDVIFAPGRYAPEAGEGRRLLAHELTHVVQQADAMSTRLAGAPSQAQAAGAVSSPSDPAEVEATEIEARVAAGQNVRVTARAGATIHRRPAYLRDHTFLGWACGGGINEVMRERLDRVQAHLQGIFDALPPAQKINPLTGAPATTLREWSGIKQSHGCWRPRGGKHSSGSACDINYATNPYIATRSQQGGQTVLGGEAAGADLQQERRRATEVYDRAVQFMGSSADSADVSARRGSGATRESTGAVYDRFRQTSDALRDYLQFAVQEPDPSNDRVNRPPIPNPEQATRADLLRLIPETERLPQNEAVAALEDYMGTSEFQIVHSAWPHDAEGQYFRILRDYELVRVPMVYGNPSARPASTRNPALGFLDLRKELVEALVDVGALRWGVSDLGVSESGDE